MNNDVNSGENTILLSILFIFSVLENNLSNAKDLLIVLQIIVAVLLIIVNIDKFYELCVKWYFKIKNYFNG